MIDKAAGVPRADILVVDDTPANLRLLSRMLTDRGYRARPVPSGALALSAIQAERPDLILLDIRMPEMDGYQVCAHLKVDPRTQDIPIIFISALDATDDKVKAFAAGGVDYVTKPFQVEEVMARVETHLSLRKLHRQLQEANAKMARELALAGRVQATFLSRQLPRVPGWQLVATLRPARETSGDFYDLNLLPNGWLGILIADVVDKGVGAALYMAMSCTLIRTYAAQYPAQPETVLSAVNRRIFEDTVADQFITLFYGVLDPATGSLVYCNAGHCPAYLVRAAGGGEVAQLIRTGMPLGVMKDTTWEQRWVEIAAGDGLVLYTDGITDAQSAAGELYGRERLTPSLEASRGRSAQEIHDAVMADVQRFAGQAAQQDDIALTVVVRDPAPQP
jgi:sigma-B regulation protein RsbU (phosphoserine phosphatase)